MIARKLIPHVINSVSGKDKREANTMVCSITFMYRNVLSLLTILKMNGNMKSQLLSVIITLFDNN